MPAFVLMWPRRARFCTRDQSARTIALAVFKSTLHGVNLRGKIRACFVAGKKLRSYMMLPFTPQKAWGNVRAVRPASMWCARQCGEVPERSNGAVSKTVVRASVPRVRIPLSPPIKTGAFWRPFFNVVDRVRTRAEGSAPGQRPKRRVPIRELASGPERQRRMKGAALNNPSFFLILFGSTSLFPPGLFIRRL